MHISMKIVVAVLVCAVILSEARPQGGSGNQQRPSKGSGKQKPTPMQRAKPTQTPKPANGGGDLKPPRRPEAVKGAGKFCGALVNGNITNNNTTFDGVFTSVSGVCTDLLAWLEANKPTDAPPAEGTGKRGPAGGKKSRGGKDSSESDDADRHGNKTAVDILLHVCEGVEKIPVDDPTIPADLKNIITRFDTECDEARKLAGGSAPTDAPVPTAAPN
ncbi:uncharacterized protein LOC127866204 [Dreissena polymorpha]|uniref:Secreted protein n=1 Tax=Dreissena polymorpha TaxID=45954 RepID=A0A9D4LR53_DREPO|nr:uncharacterized protein LOC127866204 [Dreissena polymorpha]KAH3862257.1 hypothetical protein DPMN_025223 [Dreissena polymorpha]